MPRVVLIVLLSFSVFSCNSGKDSFIKKKYLDLKKLNPIEEPNAVSDNIDSDVIIETSSIKLSPNKLQLNSDTIKLRSGEILTGDIVEYSARKHRYTLLNSSESSKTRAHYFTVAKVKYDGLVQIEGKNIRLPDDFTEEDYAHRNLVINRGYRNAALIFAAGALAGVLFILLAYLMIVIFPWGFLGVLYGVVAGIAGVAALLLGLVFGAVMLGSASDRKKKLNSLLGI
jgi:hypothetical protein